MKNVMKLLLLVMCSILLMYSTFVNAEGEITTVKYYNSNGYITRIKAETTLEEFLKNIVSNNAEPCKVYEGSKEISSTDIIKTGMKLKVGDKTYTLVVRGDISKDGKLSPTDLSQLKKHRIGLEILKDERLKAADINYSGEVSTLDISQLKMLLVGYELSDWEISKGNIIVTPNTTEPAQEVTLTIKVKENANIKYDKIKVSLDNEKTYSAYKNGLKVTENTSVKIKLVKEFLYEDYNFSDTFDIENMTPEQEIKEGESYEEWMKRLVTLGAAKVISYVEEIIIEEDHYVVNNIDNIAPDEFQFTAEKTTNSIKISAETIDTMKDYEGNIVQNNIAGVKKYQYKINNDAWQDSNEFINLAKNTEYTISVRAIDYAGNIREATNNGTVVKTDDITIENASINFEYNNTEITNQDVIVTMKSQEIEGTNYKIQYQINGTEGTWISGDKYVAKENCLIYARIADDTGQQGAGAYATATILNIDKLAPKEFTPKKIEETTTSIKIEVTVEDKEATETNCKSGIDKYIYYMLNDQGEETVRQESTENIYNFTGLDLKNHGYYIYVTAFDKAGNSTVSEGISIGQLPEGGLGIGVINPGPENVTINDGAFRYFNPVIPVGFKAVNTPDASWEGVMPKDWNKGLVIEDKFGNQFVWVPVDGTNVKYEKGVKVWDWGDNSEWELFTSQIAGDDLPMSLNSLQEEEKVQILKYEGFYVSRYEAGNDNNVLGSKEGLKVVNGVKYEQAKGYAESMYRQPTVKSGLLTGTMWDTMTKWISNEKGEKYVTNDINSGNTYETAFTFSGTYATGPNSVTEKRSAYKTGTNVKKAAKTRTLLTTGIVDKFKAKNIYDTAGNVWEYTSEYLINEESQKQYIARGGNYYWKYDKIVASGAALREYVSELEGEERNEGGFRVALFLAEGSTEVGVFEDFNRTLDGKAATYKNPVIPAGFTAVNEGGNWGNGRTVESEWDKGLVIEDVKGNEFVWVPVDGTEIKYEKWTKRGISFDDATGDDLPSVLSTWKEEEKTQVEKYGGFYIARYETSISEEQEAQTKPDKDVLLNQTYIQMKELSESVEISEKEAVKERVQTGIVTGTQWDTVMKWISIEKGEDAVEVNSVNIGTYGKNIYRTGKTALKNIYDLAGNAWEMTGEKIGEAERVYRGGVYIDNTIPVSYRGSKGTQLIDGATGFRMVLYVTGEIEAQMSVVPIPDDMALNGTKGTPPIPAASQSVTIVPSTTDWTNKDITVDIKNTNPNYTTQYQVNRTTGKWRKEKNFTVTQNCTIYARLANSKGQGGATIKYVIGNIDKVAPNPFTPSTTNIGPFSVTVKSNATDSLSGIAKCEYYINGLLAYSGPEAVYKIRNLTEKTTYSIYVVAIDRAGNTRKSNTIKVTTLDKYIQNATSLGQFVQYDGNGYRDWRVISKSDSTVTLVSNGSVAYLGLHGENGIGSGSSYLQSIANSCLNYNYAVSARSVTTGDLGTLSNIGAAAINSSYWLPSTFNNGYKNRTANRHYVATDGKCYAHGLYHLNNSYSCNAATRGVRIIVTLKDNLTICGGEGTKENPWLLEEDINQKPKAGDYVAYTANNGYNKWRIFTNNSGNLQLVSAGIPENLTLAGVDGAHNGATYMNNAAQKYINSTYATSARNVGLYELGILNGKGMGALGKAYWINGHYYHGYKGRTHGQYAANENGDVTARWETQPGSGDTQNYIGKLYHYSDAYARYTRTYGIRPIVTLKSNVKIVGGSGTESNPWRLSL